MGWITHHAIIVTGSYNHKKHIVPARAEAIKAFKATACVVSPITPKAINDTRSFFVAPDGSKEGWEESDLANVARERFIQWLDKHRYEDGSSSLRWVEVQYGDEGYDTRICRDSDERARRIRTGVVKV